MKTTKNVAASTKSATSAKSLRVAVYNALIKGGDIDTITTSVRRQIKNAKIDSIRWYISSFKTQFNATVTVSEDGEYKVKSGKVVNTPVELRGVLTTKKASKKSSKKSSK